MSKEKKEFIHMLQNMIVTFIIIFIVFTFFIGIKMAPNEDMEPRISVGDILVYYRIDKSPISQDVIIFNKNSTEYVGRVIGVPGDEIEITKEENIIVNGNTIIESKIYGSTPYYEGFVEYPVKLSADEYFILVDKRQGGEDSRYFGPINKKDIRGNIIGQFRRGGI